MSGNLSSSAEESSSVESRPLLRSKWPLKWCTVYELIGANIAGPGSSSGKEFSSSWLDGLPSMSLLAGNTAETGSSGGKKLGSSGNRAREQ